MVSVAMATYNGEKYIIKQLASILNQTYPVNEVIICDDRSSDKTITLITDFIGRHNLKNWHLYENIRNMGYVYNFHKAISLTHGDYIFLSDQDDIWLPNKVHDMLNVFEAYGNILYLHTQIAVIDIYDEIIVDKHLSLKNGLAQIRFPEFLNRLNYCGMSSAFTAEIRDLFSQVTPSDIPTHDWIMCGLSALKDGFYSYNQVFTLRRFHEANVALTFEKKREGSVDERIQLILEYRKYYSALKKYISLVKDFPLFYREVLNEKILLCDKRIRLFQLGFPMRFFTLVKHLNYYPSKKAFICDLMYAFKIFKCVLFFRRK